MRVAFYDAKPYDREYMLAAAGAEAISWSFHEFRLSAETAGIAGGVDAVCA
jgi:D-lactate dehydrogenase